MDKNNWATHWQNRLSEYEYPVSIPRAGYYIASHFKDINSSLEVGCGSARDSIYLASRGLKVSACDYEPWLIDALKEKHKDISIDFYEADAFDLQFSDNSFDLVFHSGFFIYFEDEDIVKLIKEQVRIASKYILIMVHTKQNKKQQKTFFENAKTNILYNIRFFDIECLEKVIKMSGIQYKSIKYSKFGGKADMFWSKKLKGIPNFMYPFRKLVIPWLYRFQNWKITERIACIIEL